MKIYKRLSLAEWQRMFEMQSRGSLVRDIAADLKRDPNKVKFVRIALNICVILAPVTAYAGSVKWGLIAISPVIAFLVFCLW